MSMFDSGFELFQTNGPERGKWHPLYSRRIHLGRRSNAPLPTWRDDEWLQFSDGTVSDEHAMLVWEDAQGTYRLVHQSKTNATFVNGQKITDSKLLAPDDVIQMGKVVLKVVCQGTLSSPGSGPRRLVRRHARMTLHARARLFSQLQTLLSSGVEMLRSLEVAGADDPASHAASTALANKVANGSSLSMAMEASGGVFYALEVGMVRAAELRGNLPEALMHLSQWEERDLALVRRIKGALTYPAVVFVFGLLIMLFLGRVVLLALLPSLTQGGVPLPAVTQFLMLIAHLLNPVFLVILTGTVVTVWVMRGHVLGPELKRSTDGPVLNLPVIGRLVRLVCISRFCRVLGILYQGGVPIKSAVAMAGVCTGNSVMEVQGQRFGASLEEGQTLAEALSQSALMPKTVLSMLSVAEEVAGLPRMLAHCSDMLDQDVETSLNTMVAALEPIMIVVMGIMVTFIVIGALAPMYHMISTL